MMEMTNQIEEQKNECAQIYLARVREKSDDPYFEHYQGFIWFPKTWWNYKCLLIVDDELRLEYICPTCTLMNQVSTHSVMKSFANGISTQMKKDGISDYIINNPESQERQIEGKTMILQGVTQGELYEFKRRLDDLLMK